MKTIVFFITLASAIVLSNFIVSCRSTKKIQTAVDKKDTTLTKIVVGPNTNTDSIKIVKETLEKIKANYIDYNTFSAKVKAEFDAEDQKVPDLTLYIRMKKDSLIWINVEKVFFNVARILIRKDSFFVVNKYEKYTISRPFSFLEEASQLPFDFATIQNLIVGNPVYLGDKIGTFKKNETTTSILYLGELFKHLINIDNIKSVVLHSKLDDNDLTRNRTCDLTYNDYELKDGKYFSTDRTIVVSEKSKTQIDLKFKSFQYNETLNYPFSLPVGYKIK
jgi:hypothetical protein